MSRISTGNIYIPNNATLVVSGDYEVEEVKALIEKYFGEIPAGEELTDPEPMNITLNGDEETLS